MSASARAAITNAFFLGLSLISFAAARGSLRPDLSAEIGALNRFLWRGIVLSDGAVLQPSVTADLGGLEISAWGNAELNNSNRLSGRLSEVDYCACYSAGLGPWQWSAGAQTYTFPHQGDPATTELTAVLTSPLPASPALSLYRDMDQSEGTYLSLGFGDSLAVGRLAPTGTFAVGWGNRAHNLYNYGAAVTGMTDASVNLSIDLALTPGLGLRPSVGATRLLRRELRAQASRPDNFLFGLALTGEF